MNDTPPPKTDTSPSTTIGIDSLKPYAVRLGLGAMAIIILGLAAFAVFAPIGYATSPPGTAFGPALFFTGLDAVVTALVALACVLLLGLVAVKACLWLGELVQDLMKERGSSNTVVDVEPPALDQIRFGTTADGRSMAFSELAEELGLSSTTAHDLLESATNMRFEPGDLNDNAAEEGEPHGEQCRLQAVRDAYWDCTAPDDDDLSVLHDVLVMLRIVADPTHAQQKALFDLLPARVVGNIVSWGLSDTEVRESIYEYAEENLDGVTVAVKAAGQGEG